MDGLGNPLHLAHGLLHDLPALVGEPVGRLRKTLCSCCMTRDLVDPDRHFLDCRSHSGGRFTLRRGTGCDIPGCIRHIRGGSHEALPTVLNFADQIPDIRCNRIESVGHFKQLIPRGEGHPRTVIPPRELLRAQIELAHRAQNRKIDPAEEIAGDQQRDCCNRCLEVELAPEPVEALEQQTLRLGTQGFAVVLEHNIYCAGSNAEERRCRHAKSLIQDLGSRGIAKASDTDIDVVECRTQRALQGGVVTYRAAQTVAELGLGHRKLGQLGHNMTFVCRLQHATGNDPGRPSTQTSETLCEVGRRTQHRINQVVSGAFRVEGEVGGIANIADPGEHGLDGL